MNFIETLRQFRVFDYAFFDLSVSFLGMTILSWPLSSLFSKIKIFIPKRSWIIWTLPIGILVHLMVHENTTMTIRILDPTGHWVLKTSIILLTFLGFFGVQRIKS